METISKTTRCKQSSNDSRYTGLRAFTLLELLTLIATAIVGGVLLAPALARSRPASQAAQCLNNIRQLMNATAIYTQAHHEMFPPNPDDGNTVPGHGWAAGYAGKGGGSEFNPDILANPSLSPLSTYLRSNVSVFACAADLRQGLYQGTDPRKLGTTVRAARSVSMNSAVGNVCPTFANSCSEHSGGPSIPVVGTWLTGRHSCSPSAWRTYGKTSDMVNPSPSSLFVLIEEDPWSINDSVLAFSAGMPQWIDYPSGLHNFAGIVTFADTHGELHKWVERSTRLNDWPTLRLISPNDRDWLWLRARTTTQR
jgi:hypothetical protein